MKNVYHVLLGLLCLFGELPAFAQSFTRVDTMLGPWEMVREPFLTLDTNLIPSGYLLDASLMMADLQQYRGDTVPHDTMSVDRDTYQDLFITALGSSMTVAARDSLLTFRHVNASRHAKDTLRLHALGLAYTKLDPDFETDGLLTIDTVTHRIYDVPNPSRSPYITDTTFSFTIAGVQLDTLTHDFIFERQDLVGNLDVTATNYYLDTGNGFQKYDFGTVYNLSFPAYGTYQLSLKLATTSGWRYAKAELVLEQQQQRMMMEDQCDETIDFEGGSYCIKYGPGCAGEELFRPLIIVNGFDPDGERYLRFNRMVTEFGYQFEPGHRFARKGVGEVILGDYKYDLIFVTFDEGSASNITTASWLRNAIESINAQKAAAGILEDSPIIGLSMGGLVTKIAIHQMDSLQVDHGLSKFFTFDTPLRGANIPIGVQHVLAHYYYANIAGIPLRQLDELRAGELNKKGRALYNPAAAEMLLYQGFAEVRYSPIPLFTRVEHWTTNVEHVKFQNYMDGLSISIPLYAISNGSSASNQLTVEPGVTSQIAPGEKIMRQEIITGLFNIKANGYLLPLTFQVETFGITGYRQRSFHLPSLPNFDIIAGGTRGNHDTDEFGNNPERQGGGLRWFDDYHSFIPTLSSIDSPLPGEPTTVGGNVDFTLVANEQLASRHEGVNHDVFNHKHVSVTPKIANFLVEHLDPGFSLTSIGSQVNTLANEFNYGSGVNSLNGPVSTPDILFGTLQVNDGGGLFVNKALRIADVSNTNNPQNNTASFHLTLTTGPCDSPPADITLQSGAKFIVGEDQTRIATTTALEETRVTVEGGGSLDVNTGSTFYLQSNGPDGEGGIVVQSGGIIEASWGGRIIADGGLIRIKSGGMLRTSMNGQIIAQNGGRILLEDGALVQLWGGNDSEGNGQIWIKSGGTLEIAGNYETGGSNGYFHFSRGNTVKGPGPLKIVGDNRNNRRMYVDAGAKVNLTNQDFYARNARIIYENGAGLSLEDLSEADVRNCIFKGGASAIQTDLTAKANIRSSDFEGSLIGVDFKTTNSAGARANVRDCKFNECKIGVGVLHKGFAMLSANSYPFIVSSHFTNCKIGLSVESHPSVEVTTSTFTSNQERHLAVEGFQAGLINMVNCEVFGYSSGDGATAIDLYEVAELRLDAGSYYRNGRAVQISNTSDVTLTECVNFLSNNVGVYCRPSAEGSIVNFNGSTWSGNRVGVESTTATITITDTKANTFIHDSDKFIKAKSSGNITMDRDNWTNNLLPDNVSPNPNFWFELYGSGTVLVNNTSSGCGSDCQSPEDCRRFCEYYPENKLCGFEPPIGEFQNDGKPGELTLFPNPANGQVTITNLPDDQTFGLTIFSSTGQTIQRFNNLKSPIQELDVSQFVPGFYMLQLSTLNGETQQLQFSVAR